MVFFKSYILIDDKNNFVHISELHGYLVLKRGSVRAVLNISYFANY